MRAVCAAYVRVGEFDPWGKFDLCYTVGGGSEVGNTRYLRDIGTIAPRYNMEKHNGCHTKEEISGLVASKVIYYINGVIKKNPPRNSRD